MPLLSPSKHIIRQHSLQHNEHLWQDMSTRTPEYQHELDVLEKKRQVKEEEMYWQTIQLVVMWSGGIICVLIFCPT